MAVTSRRPSPAPSAVIGDGGGARRYLLAMESSRHRRFAPRQLSTPLAVGKGSLSPSSLTAALCGAAVLVFCGSGCGESRDTSVAIQRTLPDAGGKVPWTKARCTPGQLDAQTLACVDGVAITRADYLAVVDRYPPGTSAAQIVATLVDAQVLASQAKADGLWAKWLLPVHQQAMVSWYLQDRFETRYTWQDVAQADLHQAWRDWRIRIRYVREPSYLATDAQFLCCSGDWRKCEIDVKAQKCIDGFEAQARKLHQLLAADPPRSPLEMKGRVYALNHLFPRAAVTDVNFYYLKDVPHDEQVGRGYEVMVEPYAKAVTALEDGQLSGPIRTPFGWHITRLNKYEPPLSGKLDDPNVRRDIAENILPLVRRRDVRRHAFELMKRRDVKIKFTEAVKKS